jgi:hypothetical protein
MYLTRFVQLQDGGGEEEAGEPLHCHRAHFQTPDRQVGQFFHLEGEKCEIFAHFAYTYTDLLSVRIADGFILFPGNVNSE